MTQNLDDFQKQDIKFDIAKLQQSYKEIIKTKKFDDGGGITNFGAISLTQIPGDPESIKGSNARGVYWTKPGQSGKEVSRDIDIKEYSRFFSVKNLSVPEVQVLSGHLEPRTLLKVYANLKAEDLVHKLN